MHDAKIRHHAARSAGKKVIMLPPVTKYPAPRNASIVVATYNNVETLKKTLNALFEQSFAGKYEVIVVNDGSTDGTEQFLDSYAQTKKNFRVFHQPNLGVCRARNIGIQNSQYEVVVNMDHDCIAQKSWLSKMLKGFDSPTVGIVSAYDYYGGTSTAFRRDLLHMVGGYDEDYRYYREDTDLSFKIMDWGYEFKLVDAPYLHDHVEAKPRGIIAFVRHVLKRLYYHQNDALLYRKHPTHLCEEFLHIKYGLFVDPMQDFKVATGLWKENGKMELSSPRGITFMENKTALHTLLIVLGGILYVIAVKLSRLIGSIRFGKVLV